MTKLLALLGLLLFASPALVRAVAAPCPTGQFYCSRDSACVVACPDGMYPDYVTLSCIACADCCGCCSGPGDGACITCAPGYDWVDGNRCVAVAQVTLPCPTGQYFCEKDAQCVVTCPDGTYPDPATGTCGCCADCCGCCSGPGETACLTCAAGYTMTNGLCIAVDAKVGAGAGVAKSAIRERLSSRLGAKIGA